MSLDMILVASLLSTLSSRWPERVASLCISECLLPGTAAFDNERSEHPVKYFHHTFHCVDNLPECLIAGREKMYAEYFVNKLCYRLGAVPSSVIDRYARGYAQPGALRCALQLFKGFGKDAEDLVRWIREQGKSTVPTLVLSGEHSSSRGFALGMMQEVVLAESLRWEVVDEAGHFLAEENPHRFSELLLSFMDSQLDR